MCALLESSTHIHLTINISFRRPAIAAVSTCGSRLSPPLLAFHVTTIHSLTPRPHHCSSPTQILTLVCRRCRQCWKACSMRVITGRMIYSRHGTTLSNIPLPNLTDFLPHLINHLVTNISRPIVTPTATPLCAVCRVTTFFISVQLPRLLRRPPTTSSRGPRQTLCFLLDNQQFQA
jgi:hypothetical protein